MTTGSNPPTSEVSRGRVIGLALGWLLLLGYVVWLIHNALPWLEGAPLPSQAPAAIAQVIALPPALALPGVSLSPLAVVLALALFVVLLALMLNKAPAPPQPVSQIAPTLAPEPALTPHAEEPAPENITPPEAPNEPATPPPATQADGGVVSEIVVAEEAVIIQPEPPEEPATPAPVPPPQPTRAPLQRQTTNSRRVFVSSTSRDLVKHRMRLYEALRKVDDVPVGMEDFGASPIDATAVSLDELSTADIVVLIVAWRYGFIPDGEIHSITELEYEGAKHLHLPSGQLVPVYVFLADPSTEADTGPDALFPADVRDTNAHAAQLAAFRARLSDPKNDVPDYFNTPDNLAANVLGAIGRRDGRATAIGRHMVVPARALDRANFSMGDDAAANLPYQTAPIQAAWDEATTALANARDGVGGKHGIVVEGEASSGKTRLALEALIETLPNFPVLRWDDAYTTVDLPPAGSLPGDGIVLFIDDLQNYFGGDTALSSYSAATLRALVDKAIGSSSIIVATSRTDESSAKSKLEWLFNRLITVSIKRFSDDNQDLEARRIIDSLMAAGASHREDWDGTIGSLTLGLSAKKAQYDNLVEQKSRGVTVLRAMKLLYIAGVYQYTEQRVRAVCARVFGNRTLAKNDNSWEEAYQDLLRPEFVQMRNGGVGDADLHDNAGITLTIRKEAYFDKVIHDYPNPLDSTEEERHLARLREALTKLNDVDGLFELGGTYYRYDKYRDAHEVYSEALAVIGKAGDYATDLASIWKNKGAALRALGQTQEAVNAYDEAIKRNPDLAGAWYNKGVGLWILGQVDEALKAFLETVARRPDLAGAWNNYGVGLCVAGRADEALEAFERALNLNPQLMGALKNREIALSNSSVVDAPFVMYDEALVAYDRTFTQTFDSLG